MGLAISVPAQPGDFALAGKRLFLLYSRLMTERE